MQLTELIKNSQTKERGGELFVEICPFCGKDKYHFSINREKGVYYCFVCGEKGRVNDLSSLPEPKPKPYLPPNRYFSETAFIYTENEGKIEEETLESPIFGFERLIRNELILEYLINIRKIDYPAIKYFELGLTSDGYLQIPFRDKGKLLLGYKYRTLPPSEKRFWRTKGSPFGLFNEQLFSGNEHKKIICGSRNTTGFRPPELKREVYITEGEFDCMALWQQGLPVVSIPSGASSWDRTWEEKLVKFIIYLLFDDDEVGLKASESLEKRLTEGGISCQKLSLNKILKT